MNTPTLFLLLILSSCTSLVFCAKEDELLTLLKIKEQLGNPEFLSSWVDGFDYCNSRVPHTYIECTSMGRVKSFTLRDVVLPDNASFPQAICDLTELEEIYFSQVSGLGSIPSCINNLTNLRDLSIYKSGLSGSLPELDNLKKLTGIYLGENNLSGPIPASLSNLPNLRSVKLGQNNFSGSIPAGIVHGPDAELLLNDNNLTGEIPKCYGWVNFSVIDLAGNNLTGDASFLFGKHKSVYFINLSFNQFQFDLSNVEMPEGLRYLNLSFNRLYGKVPDIASSAPHVPLMDTILIFNGLCGIEPDVNWQTEYSFYFHWHNWKGTYDLDGCLCGSPLPPCNDLAPASAPTLAP